MSMQNTTAVEKQNNIYAYAASLIEGRKSAYIIINLIISGRLTQLIAGQAMESSQFTASTVASAGPLK